MSSNLSWRPHNPPTQRDLDDKLKRALRKRYGSPIREVIDTDDLPYFAGLRDGGIADAEKVIEAVKRHGTIELREEF